MAHGERPPPLATSPFRVCGSCQKEWPGWRDFLSDPEIQLLGLQVVPERTAGNILVFGHSCGTSISVFSERLRELVPGPAANADPLPSLDYQECRQRCRKVEVVAVCDRPCVKARDRRLLRLILELKTG